MKKQQTSKRKFKAEIHQLLDILAHSLYKHRDVFIRELISNAVDALEKLRFQSVTRKDFEDKDSPLEINIKLDKEKKIFTIIDSGIGMSKDEIVENIGTIAKSGTSDFLKAMKKAEKGESDNLIGKFGVGFYSVFIAAKEVKITSKSYLKNESAIEWKSSGTESYSIKEIDKAPRGTKIEVFLKDDAEEFAEKYAIESAINKYSNFLPFPIKIEDTQINKVKAIWREPKSNLKEEDYKDYYKFLTNYDEFLSYLHFSTDSPIQFSSLLFVPKMKLNMFNSLNENYGPNLFVKRILIESKCKELLPNYLAFIEGVVDTED